MSAPLKPWEATTLNNNSNVIRSVNPTNPAIPQIGSTNTTRPALPPKPSQNSYGVGNYNSYSPYSGYGGYGNGSYSSMPYRSSLFSSPYSGYGSYGTGAYGGYGSYGGIGGYSGLGMRDNTEERFIQYAEERSRDTFSSIENVVRAFSSISMMLDNTLFAMTSSFRAVLSVADNFGRLRSVFGQIWYSINIFRLLNWLYRHLRLMLGLKVTESGKTLAWNEAATDAAAEAAGSSGRSSWPTLAFLGVIVSLPYVISKLLPKYEDKCDPQKWLSSGVRAKAAFDFVSTSPNELTINTNDDIVLAPKQIQEEMRLYNTGWAFAACNGRTGVIPLNYIVVVKNVNNRQMPPISSNLPAASFTSQKAKRVSFGENQIINLKSPPEDDTNINEKEGIIDIKKSADTGEVNVVLHDTNQNNIDSNIT